MKPAFAFRAVLGRAHGRYLLLFAVVVVAGALLVIPRPSASALRTIAPATKPRPTVAAPPLVAPRAAPDARPVQPLNAMTRVPTHQVLPDVNQAVADWRDYAPGTITVALHPDLPIRFSVVRVHTSDASTTWVGKNALTGASLVGVGTARRWDAVLSLPGATYDIHVTGDTALIVEKSAGIDCAPPVRPSPRTAAMILGLPSPLATAPVPLETTTPQLRTAAQVVRTVDVAFFYAADAEALAIQPAGSIAAVPDYMNSTYRAYVETINLILERSNVANMRWHFLGAFRVPNYTPVVIDHKGDGGAERYDILQDMTVFAETGNPVGDFVATKRAEIGADQCVLVVGDRRQYSGIADSPGNFSVILLSSSNLTAAHEMGHNLGLSHDRTTDHIPDGDGSYAHGYSFEYPRFYGDLSGTTWRPIAGDVMAYAAQMPYYSNPDVFVTGTSFAYTFAWIVSPDDNLYRLGVPAGEPKAADAARTIREYAATIAAAKTLASQTFPSFTLQPAPVAVQPGGDMTLTATATGSDVALQWFMDGTELAGATSSKLVLAHVTPAAVGLYDVIASNSTGSLTSEPAAVGISSAAKIAGDAVIVSLDIHHPNGNVYDQILLTGSAAAITADPNKITRISFVDQSDDIVQVEFSGTGTLSISLADSSGPAVATKYNQPDVKYMKGQASIVITGANETTNVSVFTVGTATAVNQTLFKSDTAYDGVANISYIAIASNNGRFGGIRTANASYSGSKGLTGFYARGIQFAGPIYVANITASGDASPILIAGSASDVRVTGGDLWQPNSQPVRVAGFTALHFTDGSDSHGRNQPVRVLRARLERDGQDVTSVIQTK